MRWRAGYNWRRVESKKCIEFESIFLKIKVRVHSMGGRKLIPLRGYAARERRWKRGEQESMSGEIFGLVGSFSPLPKARLPAAKLSVRALQCASQRVIVTRIRTAKHIGSLGRHVLRREALSFGRAAREQEMIEQAIRRA
jgi:hypothetical protein